MLSLFLTSWTIHFLLMVMVAVFSVLAHNFQPLSGPSSKNHHVDRVLNGAWRIGIVRAIVSTIYLTEKSALPRGSDYPTYRGNPSLIMNPPPHLGSMFLPSPIATTTTWNSTACCGGRLLLQSRTYVSSGFSARAGNREGRFLNAEGLSVGGSARPFHCCRARFLELFESADQASAESNRQLSTSRDVYIYIYICNHLQAIFSILIVVQLPGHWLIFLASCWMRTVGDGRGDR